MSLYRSRWQFLLILQEALRASTTATTAYNVLRCHLVFDSLAYHASELCSVSIPLPRFDSQLHPRRTSLRCKSSILPRSSWRELDSNNPTFWAWVYRRARSSQHRLTSQFNPEALAHLILRRKSHLTHSLRFPSSKLEEMAIASHNSNHSALSQARGSRFMRRGLSFTRELDGRDHRGGREEWRSRRVDRKGDEETSRGSMANDEGVLTRSGLDHEDR